MSSETRTIGEIQDKALFRVRPMFAAIEGVSAPPPFGGSQRTVVVRTDPDRLRAYGISADDVVKALGEGNTIAPSGQIRDAIRMPLVPSNAMVVQPSELGAIEIKPKVFLRDVVRRDPVNNRPLIDDASDIPTGYALVNGKRAVYILVTKRANASTLAVVNNVKANLPKMQAELPDDIKVSFEFDQSPYVINSIKGVAIEAALSATLGGFDGVAVSARLAFRHRCCVEYSSCLAGCPDGALADRSINQPNDTGRVGIGRWYSGR